MACAAYSDEEDFLSDSFTLTSDELKEMHCEDCDKELGTYETADGYCVDCFVYLCTTCLRYHKKHLPQHTLQDRDNMPQDFCFEKCPKHPREILKFYCNSCEGTACPKCKAEKHDNCSEVCHIPTMVQSVKMNDRIKELTLSFEETLEKLAAKKEKVVSKFTEVDSYKKNASAAMLKHKETLKRQVQDQHNQLLENLNRKQTQDVIRHDARRAEIIAQLDREKAELLESFSNEKAKLTQQIRSQQKEIFENIDKTEQDLEKKSAQMKEKDLGKLKLVSSKIDKTKTEVEDMRQSIDRKMRSGQSCELFVALKETEQHFEKIKSNDMGQDIEINNYDFKENTDMINLKSPSGKIPFGTIVEKSAEKRAVSFVHHINITSDCDKTRSKVTGLCKFSDFLVVSDQTNKSIKLINTKQNKLLNVLKLNNQPFDVTCIDIEQVATTLPDIGKVLFLLVTQTGEISSAREINVGKKCYGIEYLKPNLMVTCRDPGCVQIFSVYGELIQTIPGFCEPTYVNVNLNNEIFYVEDAKAQTDKQSSQIKYWKIKKVRYDGQIVKESNKDNRSQCGLAVDRFGSVYIGFHFKLLVLWTKLLKLSADLETIQEIDISEYMYRGWRLSCLFHCDKENRLYVGTSGGKILVFKVTQ